MPETHLHDWLVTGAVLDVAFELDAHNGVTDAILRCRGCGQYGLLGLLDWASPKLTCRVYAVAELSAEPVAVFLRNMRSEFCDLTRKSAEHAALCATAEPANVVIAAEVPALAVLASQQARVRRPAWREDLLRPGESGWLQRLHVV